MIFNRVLEQCASRHHGQPGIQSATLASGLMLKDGNNVYVVLIVKNYFIQICLLHTIVLVVDCT